MPIRPLPDKACRRGCRSFTGAWIETWYGGYKQPKPWVAPSRERGLKHIPLNKMMGDVASLLHGSVD